MNRRDLFASLAFAALNVEAQESAPSPSLYIPNAHRVDDRKLLHDFMEEFAFVDLVTTSPLRITHIPVVFERAAGPFGTIHGHIARHNEQIAAFDGKQEAVIVFRGPHGYISPTCYRTAPAVPTWNFAVVHATGKLQPKTGPAALHAFLASLIQKFETYEGTGYDFSQTPDSYLNPMLANIVGFDMRVELLEGKFKLGQERPDGDREGILKYLETARAERSLHDLTKSFYARKAG
ncbi:MAG TPA: FMN-binding negative transcriptional regulator [Bryobacteraceae bacterium]|jgi:transcriptional regulator|nr:FMN-binding negative transcriptional regulator [Bryobacteraceae bacterium]